MGAAGVGTVGTADVAGAAGSAVVAASGVAAPAVGASSVGAAVAVPTSGTWSRWALRGASMFHVKRCLGRAIPAVSSRVRTTAGSQGRARLCGSQRRPSQNSRHHLRRGGQGRANPTPRAVNTPKRHGRRWRTPRRTVPCGRRDGTSGCVPLSPFAGARFTVPETMTALARDRASWRLVPRRRGTTAAERPGVRLLPRSARDGRAEGSHPRTRGAQVRSPHVARTARSPQQPVARSRPRPEGRRFPPARSRPGGVPEE